MKTLILLRHGKSSWEYSVSDKDRPLLQRGIFDAISVADSFNEQGVTIDAVFSSPANRALHTATIFLRQLYVPLEKLEVKEELYDFTGDLVFKFVKKLHNHLNTVVVFGHNHAFTHLSNALGDKFIENVPTSGLVQLEFDVDSWAGIEKGTTKQTIFPKQLKNDKK